jgi:hypothetical protein
MEESLLDLEDPEFAHSICTAVLKIYDASTSHHTTVVRVPAPIEQLRVTLGRAGRDPVFVGVCFEAGFLYWCPSKATLTEAETQACVDACRELFRRHLPDALAARFLCSVNIRGPLSPSPSPTPKPRRSRTRPS